MRQAYEKLFRRYKFIDGISRSKADMWLYENILCPLLGHKWEWWRLIERSKCERCLEPNRRESRKWDHMIAFRYFNQEKEYRRLQTPFWKLAGQKPSDDDVRREKFLKNKNMDYYDLQKLRDQQEQASFMKNPDDWKNIKKPVKVEYEKRKVQFE